MLCDTQEVTGAIDAPFARLVVPLPYGTTKEYWERRIEKALGRAPEEVEFDPIIEYVYEKAQCFGDGYQELLADLILFKRLGAAKSQQDYSDLVEMEYSVDDLIKYLKFYLSRTPFGANYEYGSNDLGGKKIQ